MVDLNYSLYVNTCQDLRQKHLSSLLHLYFDIFEQICDRLSVPLLPAWSWEEFNRRFHRAQIFGIYLSVSLLPLILENPDEIKDMETAEEVQTAEEGDTEENVKKLVKEMAKVSYTNRDMLRRLRETLEDGVSAGII